MKDNIFHQLGDSFNNISQRNKEFKKIPGNFWMDLNDLDYRKFHNTYPKRDNTLLSLIFIHQIATIIGGGFFLYVIADFMDYEIINLILIKIILNFLPVLTGFIFFMLLVCCFIDLIFDARLATARKRCYIAFYKRLKTYKKSK